MLGQSKATLPTSPHPIINGTREGRLARGSRQASRTSRGIPPHDAAGAAGAHVGADQRKVGRKGEVGDDPPGVAPVD